MNFWPFVFIEFLQNLLDSFSQIRRLAEPTHNHNPVDSIIDVVREPLNDGPHDKLEGVQERIFSELEETGHRIVTIIPRVWVPGSRKTRDKNRQIIIAGELMLGQNGAVSNLAVDSRSLAQLQLSTDVCHQVRLNHMTGILSCALLFDWVEIHIPRLVSIHREHFEFGEVLVLYVRAMNSQSSIRLGTERIGLR